MLKTKVKNRAPQKKEITPCSILLCTKNRTDEVRVFLDSLVRQTRKPEEVLVLDGGSNPLLEKIVKEYSSHFDSVRYETVDGDLTTARNKGIRLFQSEVAFFLDDDLVLDEKFIEQIMSVFEEDQNKKIGGICGTISNHIRQKGLRKLLTDLFFLPGDGDGRFRLSGAAKWPYGLPDQQKVEFLPGGLTAYRREVFQNNLFDDALPLFGFTDDVDFSYRVSRDFTNIYNPRAKALHSRPSSSRAMEFGILKLWLWAYWRTYIKNRKWQLIGYGPLLLLSLGFILKFLESNVRSVMGQKVPVTS